MTTVFAFFGDVEPEEFRRATDVTYHGSVWGMQAALRRMGPRDHGTIVQVGSAMAYRGIPLQAPYCGAKHAVQGVFESLRTELRHKGSNVHLTTVHLPGVNTPQFEHCRDKFDKRSQPVAPVWQLSQDAVVAPSQVASQVPTAETVRLSALSFCLDFVVWLGTSCTYRASGTLALPRTRAELRADPDDRASSLARASCEQVESAASRRKR